MSCNRTLIDLEEADIVEDPLFGEVTFHHVGLIVSALFGLIAVVVALFIMFQHATHYSKPYEQKHIIRILFMIPVYATVSFLSYLFYKHAIYFEVIRDCYEAFAIAAFFTLMCHYVAPTLHDQKEYFRTIKPKNWWSWNPVWLMQKCTGGENKGPFRKPQSGLTWFNVIWVGVFQYCFIRVLFTIVSVLTQAIGRYCESSLSPVFAHIWVLVFEGAAVTVAMFCLIQFYLQLKDDLAEHRPFLKILSIKLVIFFSFWQNLVIGFVASSSGPMQPTNKIAYPDIQVGIPSMALCIEMAAFAILHIFSFPWKPYLKATLADPMNAHGSGFSGANVQYVGGPFGIKAFAEAFNPWDIIKQTARGFRWLFVGRRYRHQDVSYQTKIGGDDMSLSSGVNGAKPYHGPTFAGNGEAAVEDTASSTELRRQQTHEEDRAGLLSHAQHDPYSSSYPPQSDIEERERLHAAGRLPPYPKSTTAQAKEAGFPQSFSAADTADLSSHPAYRDTSRDVSPYPPRGTRSSISDDDTAYRGAAHLPPRPKSGGGPGQAPQNDWNMFGGASGQPPPLPEGQHRRDDGFV